MPPRRNKKKNTNKQQQQGEGEQKVESAQNLEGKVEEAQEDPVQSPQDLQLPDKLDLPQSIEGIYELKENEIIEETHIAQEQVKPKTEVEQVEIHPRVQQLETPTDGGTDAELQFNNSEEHSQQMASITEELEGKSKKEDQLSTQEIKQDPKISHELEVENSAFKQEIIKVNSIDESSYSIHSNLESEQKHQSEAACKPQVKQQQMNAETPTQQPDEVYLEQKHSVETPTQLPEEDQPEVRRQEVPMQGHPELHQSHQQIHHSENPIVEIPPEEEIKQQISMEKVPEAEVQSNDVCSVQGLPTFEVNQKTEDVHLEQFKPAPSQSQVEQVTIEAKSEVHTEQNKEVSLERQPEAQSQTSEQVVIEKQSQVSTSQNNQGSIEKRAIVEVWHSIDTSSVQEQPKVQLEDSRLKQVNTQEQPRTNLSANNDETSIEKHPEPLLEALQQQTHLQEHPIVQLEENFTTENTEVQPIHQIEQTEQSHQISQKPEQEIHQQIQQEQIELATQVEVQQVFADTSLEQKQVVQLEFNQLEQILEQEEEKVFVVQTDFTSVEVQPTAETVNAEVRGSVEEKPVLKTEQNKNPVGVSHNDDVRLEGYFAEKKQQQPQQQQQQHKLPKIEEQPKTQPEVQFTPTPQPSNDAENQFLHQESSQIKKTQSQIMKSVQQAAPDVGVIGLSLAAAAAASTFILKKGVSTKDGALVTLISSAICYVGYKLSTLRKTKSEIQK